MSEILIIILTLLVVSMCVFMKGMTELDKRIVEIEKKIDNIQYQFDDVLCDMPDIWHDASEEPQGDNYKILCVDDYDLYWMAKRANILGLHNKWDEYVAIEGVKMWAYISDLLPKQLRKSEQEKGGEE